MKNKKVVPKSQIVVGNIQKKVNFDAINITKFYSLKLVKNSITKIRSPNSFRKLFHSVNITEIDYVAIKKVKSIFFSINFKPLKLRPLYYLALFNITINTYYHAYFLHTCLLNRYESDPVVLMIIFDNLRHFGIPSSTQVQVLCNKKLSM